MMQDVLEVIANDYFNTKVFDTKIRDNIAIPASQREQKSVFEYDAKCNASVDYLDFIKELILDGKSQEKTA